MIDEYLKNIMILRKQADELDEDNPGSLMQKIQTLVKCQMFIGRVSSIIDGDYKRIYANRKYKHAIAYKNAIKDKPATAEIAVKELRDQEATIYQDMTRWRNAFMSTTEELHSLKLKMKIDFYDGSSSNVPVQSDQQTRSN
jgi:hypothetical protein